MAWEQRGRGDFAGSENERPAAGERWMLLCGGEDFCADAQREMYRRRDLRAVAADNLASARQFLEAGEIPAAILAEERALAEGTASARQRRQTLAAGILSLAAYAPVVWIGNPEDDAEISPLLQDVLVDFVPRSALCVSAAVNMMERRLRAGEAALGGRSGSRFSFTEQELEGRDFGEILRHELNNPLTGILGNAELLLLEVRRGRIALDAHNLQRLETITDLAVRMREAVRLLSDRWQAAEENLSAEKVPPAETPRWPAGG